MIVQTNRKCEILDQNSMNKSARINLSWFIWRKKIIVSHLCQTKWKKKKMSDSFWRTNWSQIESIFRSWCFFSFFYPTHNTISTSTLNVIWKMFWFLFSALFFFCIFSFPFLFEFVSLSDELSVVFFCSFLLRQHKRCIPSQLPHRRRRNENGWWCSTKD